MIPLRAISISLVLAGMVGGAPPRSKAANRAVKSLVTTQADQGITPRAILYIRDLTGTQKVQLREATFTRIPPVPKDWRERLKHPFPDSPPSMWLEGGKEINVYKVTSKGVLDQRTVVESTVLVIRATKAGPQMSIDRGRTWADGEKADTQWKFAFDSALYTLDRADETFTARSFKAWGFERGPAVKFPRTTLGPQITSDFPVMQSMVACVAYGTNEISGTLKFPGTEWVVPFRGVKWGDAWIGLSLEPRPFMGSMAIQPFERARTRGYYGELQTGPLWLVFTPNSVLVGKTRNLDLAHMDRILDGFIGAGEFDLGGARELPSLADAYRDHQAKSLWLRSDEPDSFSWAADKAFVEAGLTLNLYPPIKSIAFNGAEEKAAIEQLARWSQRIKSLGGKVATTPVPAW